MKIFARVLSRTLFILIHLVTFGMCPDGRSRARRQVIGRYIGWFIRRLVLFRLFGGIRKPAEDRAADANDGRAFEDGHFEVVGHAH